MAQPKNRKKGESLRERKKLRTRRDLFDVAQTLFAESEFDEVTVGQIADLAHVSQNTFFNYFQNKSQFLSEYMQDWLMTIGLWTFDESPITDCRSAIVPSDIYSTLDWIIEHRRMLRMALQYTDFLDFIYKLDPDSVEYDDELHRVIRLPRLERVRQAKAKGVIRGDISSTAVCRLYDGIRIDAVRRWLYTRDEDATGELLYELYEEMVEPIIRGVEA